MSYLESKGFEKYIDIKVLKFSSKKTLFVVKENILLVEVTKKRENFEANREIIKNIEKKLSGVANSCKIVSGIRNRSKTLKLNLVQDLSKDEILILLEDFKE